MSEHIDNIDEKDLFRNLIEAIRSSLDIKIVKKAIVDVIGKSLKADRCFIMEYDKVNNKFLNIGEEYLSSNEMPPYLGIDLNENIPKFVQEFIKGKIFLLNKSKASMNGEEIDLNDGNFEAEKNAIAQYKVHSGLVFPIYYLDDFLGDLVLHYVDEAHEAGEDEIILLKDLANQIGIAIHQANLYKSIKQSAERETLIRKITERIRSSLSPDETFSFVCEEIARLFSVQRVTIVQFHDLNNYENYTIHKEYKTITEVKGLLSSEYTKNAAAYWGENLLNKEDIISFDNISESNTPDYFRKCYESIGVKSMIGLPVKSNEKKWGTIVLSEYNNYRHWSDEEKELLRTIASQIYIAINQAELYEYQKKLAQREFILREIVETIRAEIDLDKTKQIIVKTIGDVLKADRCFITDYDTDTNKFLPIKYEYLNSEDTVSVVNINVQEVVPGFIEVLKNGKYLLVKNKEIFLENEKQDFTIEQETLTRYGVHSSFAVPLIYQTNFLGVLSIHYVDESHEIGDFEINLMKDIANQVAIAIYKAKLYETIQLKSEREKLLRRIFEAMRSSLDMNIIKQTIVNEVGAAFNSNICFIMSYDREGDFFYVDEYSEYRSSDEEKSFIGLNLADDSLKWLMDGFKNQKEINYSNIEEFLEENDLQSSELANFLKSYNLKSAYNIPIFYGDKSGYLVVKFTHNYKLLSEDDLILLRNVAIQSGVALYQAKLYETIQLQAEREKISRNIIEILRSSIDKTIIKKLFVKNIGKFFEADRVFLVDYDSNEKRFLPIDKDAEYLSSPNEKSFVGVDWSKHFISDYYQSVQEKREVKIFAIDEYIKNSESGGDIIKLLEEARVKSSYSFPVFYQDKVIGSFCIDFTHRNTKLSDEDINRIRNMCTQAGIALYHATLYEEAQKCFQSKKAFFAEYSEKIVRPTNEILDRSKLLFENEFGREIQVEYLNQIINACNQLLELTKSINEN